jgi:hypothetical protein
MKDQPAVIETFHASNKGIENIAMESKTVATHKLELVIV